jgi:hypothetical protein
MSSTDIGKEPGAVIHTDASAPGGKPAPSEEQPRRGFSSYGLSYGWGESIPNSEQH